MRLFIEKRSTNSFILILFIALLISGVFFKQPCRAVENSSGNRLKVGFLFPGPINDAGWDRMHEEGRQYVQRMLGSKVETIFAESVGENAEAERIIEKMIAQGTKLIFAPSFGFLDPVQHCAARHPDIVFMQISRFSNAKNIGSYFYMQYQPMYIGGVVAAHVSTKGKLAYLGSRPVPPTLQAVNAFALGAQSVNPKIKLRAIWTNTWFDPIAEAEAANALSDAGFDVLAFDFSNVAIVKTAEKRGVKVIGSYGNYHDLAPKQWLTGSCYNWGPFYTKICQSVLDHSWKSGNYICDMSNGVMNLSTFGPAVSRDTAQEASLLKKNIASGKQAIFKGPQKDNEGKLQLSSGKSADLKWLENMDFLISGIDGKLPKN